MAVSDAEIVELALALHKANEPKPPTTPKPFDYPLTEAIARAKAGSVPDARMLLMLAAAMLNRPVPAAFGCVMLNGELAAYLAESLDKAARGVNAKRALRLARNRGRSALDNAQRDTWIAYIAELHKHWGSRTFLADTANLLTAAGLSPASGDGWTSDNVRKAIKANADRGIK